MTCVTEDNDLSLASFPSVLLGIVQQTSHGSSSDPTYDAVRGHVYVGTSAQVLNLRWVEYLIIIDPSVRIVFDLMKLLRTYRSRA